MGAQPGGPRARRRCRAPDLRAGGDRHRPRAGEARIKRCIYPVGMRWSTDLAPLVGTDSCRHAHAGFLAHGALHFEFADGCAIDLVAPAAVDVAPGHDAWVIGDEPAVLIEVDFEADTVARLGVAAEHSPLAVAGLAVRQAPRRVRLAGQAEDLLAEDVVLDLVGAAGDRLRRDRDEDLGDTPSSGRRRRRRACPSAPAIERVRRPPPGGRRCSAPSLPSEPSGPGGRPSGAGRLGPLGGPLGGPLQSTSSRRSAGGRAGRRDAAPARRLLDHEVGPAGALRVPGVGLGEVLVGLGRGLVERPGPAAASRRRAAARRRTAARGPAWSAPPRQPVARRADDVVGRDPGVGQEHLVERRRGRSSAAAGGPRRRAGASAARSR